MKERVNQLVNSQTVSRAKLTLLMKILRDADGTERAPLLKAILAYAPLETEVGRGQTLPDREGLV